MAASAATASSSPGLCPNYAVICSFLERYGALLDLPELSFPQLERYLQDTSSVPKLLVDLHVKLLRKIGKSVSADRWEKYLVKVCQEFNTTWAWELEEKGYKELTLECKTGILKYLCECQFDENVKFKTAINEEDPDKMRLQPIGRDKDGQMYWFQLDQDNNVRVYVEEQDDLDGSSWKCIVRDRNDLAEVVALLKTQIDPELLKREEQKKEKAEDNKDEVKKSDDSSDEDSKDSIKVPCPVSPKTENHETVTQKEDLKSETSLNGVIDGTEADLHLENISTKASKIKEEPVEVSDTKSNTAATEPTPETPCLSVNVEKAAEVKRNNAEDIQQTLKKDQQAKIPLKKRGMKFSEEFEKNSGIIVQNTSVCQSKETSKSDMVTEQTKKAQSLNDHVNGEIQSASEKDLQSHLDESLKDTGIYKEQTTEKTTDKSVIVKESELQSTEKDVMKDKQSTDCSTEKVLSHQADFVKKDLDVQAEKEITAATEKREAHRSPSPPKAESPPLPNDRNITFEKSSNHEKHEEMKERPGDTEKSCSVERIPTSKESPMTDESDNLHLNREMTSKETESKHSEEKTGCLDVEKSNSSQNEEIKISNTSEMVLDMKQTEESEKHATVTDISEINIEKSNTSVPKEKPEVTETTKTQSTDKHLAKETDDPEKTVSSVIGDNTKTQEVRSCTVNKNTADQSEEISNTKETVAADQSQEISNTKETVAADQSEEISNAKEIVAADQSQEISNTKETVAADQSEEISNNKQTVAADQSEEISNSKEIVAADQSEEMSNNKETVEDSLSLKENKSCKLDKDTLKDAEKTPKSNSAEVNTEKMENSKRTEKPEDTKKSVNCEDNMIHETNKIRDCTLGEMEIEAEALKQDLTKPQDDDKLEVNSVTQKTEATVEETSEEKNKPTSPVEKTMVSKETEEQQNKTEAVHQSLEGNKDANEQLPPSSKEKETDKSTDEERKSKGGELGSRAKKEFANGGEDPVSIHVGGGRRKMRHPVHRRKAELQRAERQGDSESDSNTGRSLRRSPRISRPTAKVVEIQDRKPEKPQVAPPGEKCEKDKDEKEEDKKEEEEVVKTVQKKPREKKPDQEGQPKPKVRKRRKVRWSNTRTRRKKKGSEDEDDNSDEESSEEEESEEEDDSDEDYKVERKRKRRNRNRERRSSDSSTSSDDDLPPNDDPCKHCGLPNHPELILLCDSCDNGYHTACLRPPLMIIPDGEWFCPPCQHKQLCDKLDEQLQNLDAALKKKERAERRKERLIYVGISVENIITPSVEVEEEKPEIIIKEKKEAKRSKSWGRRSTRAKKTISYRFDEFDEAIEEAIEEDIKEAEGGGAGRGKDMANITGHRGKDMSTILQAEEGKENGRPPRPSASQRRKKRRRLNDLDSDSTVDEEESEEEFRLSESSEEEFVASDNESEAETEADSNNSDFGSDKHHASSKSRRPSKQRRSFRKRQRPRWYSDDEEEETDEEVEDEIATEGSSEYSDSDLDMSRRRSRRSLKKQVNYCETSESEGSQAETNRAKMKPRRRQDSSESEASFSRDSEESSDQRVKRRADSSEEDSRQRRRRLALKRRRASEDDDSEDDSDESSEEDRPIRKRVNRIDSDDDDEEEEVKSKEKKAEEESKGANPLDCGLVELTPTNRQSPIKSLEGFITRPSAVALEPPKSISATPATAIAPNGLGGQEMAAQDDDEDDLLGVTDLVDYVCNNEQL